MVMTGYDHSPTQIQDGCHVFGYYGAQSTINFKWLINLLKINLPHNISLDLSYWGIKEQCLVRWTSGRSGVIVLAAIFKMAATTHIRTT